LKKKRKNQDIRLKKGFRIEANTHIGSTSEINYRYFHHYKELYPYTHDHQSFYEVFLVIKGKCYHLVNNRKIVLSKGQMVFIRPNDIHKFEKFNKEAFNAINLAFYDYNLDDLKTFVGEGLNLEKLLSPALPPEITLTERQLLRITDQMERLHLTPHDQKGLIRMRLRALLTEIFTEHFENATLFASTERPVWLEKLLVEINKPANFIAGNTRLIELACKSQEHIIRIFKEFLNTTPSQYIKQLRLTYASNMLLHSNKTIPEIAYESGFENLSYFYREFKKKFGCTPKKFRA